MSLQFDFIGIVTRDLAASLAFYRLLGLDIPEHPADAPHVEHVLPSGMKLAWDPVATIQSFDPDFDPGATGSGIGFAFQAGSAEEVDAAHAAIVAAGHESKAKPWDAPWGQRYASVLDPDGNGIDIYAPLS
ncbi:VOC family protein [Leucobacter luti]|uniref:VOC family protein n=1 Tax=Leucobacter luti TaxID=340320 RepID=UPI003D07B825